MVKKVWTYGHNITLMLLAFLTAVLVTACSSEEDTNGQSEVDILSRFNSEGKAWMSLQIPLGGQGITRTSFDDGIDDEWRVKDAYILIFAGASEATAKFASAYKMETPSLNTSVYSQITAFFTFTINDANINTGDKLFVFALLNNNSSAITTSSFPTTSVTFANGGSNVTLTGGSSLASILNGITIDRVDDGSGYFLMTNATLAEANTTSAQLKTIVEMPAGYFFPTEEEAKANPAGRINVERLAAKATVEDGLTNHFILGNSYATFESSDLMWALDNYNSSSYAYKHLSAVSYQRFVETNAVEPYYPLRYRTYWAEDVNYSGSSGLTYVPYATYMSYTEDQKSAFWKSIGSNAYCAENTFDVGYMQDDCTTSVLVRLKLNNGGDFYTTSVTGQDIIFQPPSNDLTEEGTSASESFARRRSNEVTYDGTNIATIDDYLRTWLMEQSVALRNWVRDYAGNEKKHLKIEVSGNAETGLATATLSQTAQTSGTGFNKFESLTDAYAETGGVTLKAYLQALLNSLTIKFYDDGYCYYRVLIRHFDDTQTPWSSAASMTDNTPAVVYGGDAEKYLGRYGMVRNNWYNISINSVTHVGSPIIPPLTTNADDKVEQLLNATLHISGWEKHEQNL